MTAMRINACKCTDRPRHQPAAMSFTKPSEIAPDNTVLIDHSTVDEEAVQRELARARLTDADGVITSLFTQLSATTLAFIVTAPAFYCADNQRCICNKSSVGASC